MAGAPVAPAQGQGNYKPPAVTPSKPARKSGPATTATSSTLSSVSAGGVASAPPKQAGFQSGTDVANAAKFTNSTMNSIYKNLMTTQQGQARQATSAMDRTLAGMARMSAKGELAAAAATHRANQSLVNQYGTSASSVTHQDLQTSKVTNKASAIMAAGEQRGASDLAAGNSQAFQAFNSAAQTSLAAAKTALAQQMKEYNNAVASSSGAAKTILANSADDGATVAKIYAGKNDMNRGQFVTAVSQAYGPDTSADEINLMWLAYQHMGKGMDAGAAFQTATQTLYGDQLSKKYINHIGMGIHDGVYNSAVNTFNNALDAGKSIDDATKDMKALGASDAMIATIIADYNNANPNGPVVTPATGGYHNVASGIGQLGQLWDYFTNPYNGQ